MRCIVLLGNRSFAAQTADGRSNQEQNKVPVPAAESRNDQAKADAVIHRNSRYSLLY